MNDIYMLIGLLFGLPKLLYWALANIEESPLARVAVLAAIVLAVAGMLGANMSFFFNSVVPWLMLWSGRFLIWGALATLTLAVLANVGNN